MGRKLCGIGCCCCPLVAALQTHTKGLNLPAPLNLSFKMKDSEGSFLIPPSFLLKEVGENGGEGGGEKKEL